MTADQEATARELLREGLGWIGMVDLTEDEEAKAGEVQKRIHRLLADLGDGVIGSSITDCYRVALSVRAHLERAAGEKERAKEALDLRLTMGSSADATVPYLIRRFQMAYGQWEQAERAYYHSEGAYYRALSQEGEVG